MVLFCTVIKCACEWACSEGQSGEFAGSLGLDWKCTDSWLTRFKHRHISYKKLCGEAGSVETAATNAWTEDILKPALSRFRPQDVFNADKSGLFRRLLPDKTLAFQSEKCVWGKNRKKE